MLKDAPLPIPLAEIGPLRSSGGRRAGGRDTRSANPPARQADTGGSSPDGGADRSGSLMPYGNNDKQLSCLPRKVIALVGPQFTVRRVAPVESHGPVESVNV